MINAGEKNVSYRLLRANDASQVSQSISLTQLLSTLGVCTCARAPPRGLRALTQRFPRSNSFTVMRVQNARRIMIGGKSLLSRLAWNDPKL